MKRSKHSLSNYKLFSCDMGELIPCGITEVLPGDTLQHATSVLLRCSPLLAPVMHPVRVRVHHWYVPFRLIWDDWEEFITGGPDGMDDSEFPTMKAGNTSGYAVGSLCDYLGVPPGVPGLEHSALPIRAYQLIFNEWYRDQDLQSEVAISTASGLDTTTSRGLRSVNWEKDYFTSARPWEQKGPSISIPLGTSAPVVSDGSTPSVTGPSGDADFVANGADARFSVNIGTGDVKWKNAGLEADLSGASAVTVNILREAMALQRYEEARARYGSRYVEYLRYLSVRSSDARLQRPEYLGGGKQVIQFSEVLQTAQGDDPVGEMRGHGISALRTNRYRRFFEEHGYVISMLSVQPRTMYAQGLERHWNRRTKEDFWQRELQHIGQQEIFNKEVYAPHSDPDGTFGYQDRYDEYRRQPNTVAGEFRTSVLDFWHMARVFNSDPALNADFVKCVPTKRNFAVQTNDLLYVMCNHSIQARRLVSKVGKSFIY
ncbi:MAG: major capsid protein [Candidatus Methanomethylicaceae archaeon]